MDNQQTSEKLCGSCRDAVLTKTDENRTGYLHLKNNPFSLGTDEKESVGVHHDNNKKVGEEERQEGTQRADALTVWHNGM